MHNRISLATLGECVIIFLGLSDGLSAYPHESHTENLSIPCDKSAMNIQEHSKMRSVPLTGICIVLSLLSLTACSPTPTATSVALLPSQTPFPEPSATPTSTAERVPLIVSGVNSYSPVASPVRCWAPWRNHPFMG